MNFFVSAETVCTCGFQGCAFFMRTMLWAVYAVYKECYTKMLLLVYNNFSNTLLVSGKTYQQMLDAKIILRKNDRTVAVNSSEL